MGADLRVSLRSGLARLKIFQRSKQGGFIDLDVFRREAIDRALQKGLNPAALEDLLRSQFIHGFGQIPFLSLASVEREQRLAPAAFLRPGLLAVASLDDPLPWDVIAKSDYDPLNDISALVEDLKAKSEKRVAASAEFGLVRDDIARYQKIIKDKSVSMNQAERLKEREENKKRDEARKSERLNHRNDPKFFEVTLRNSVEPGLQVWQPKTNQVTRIADPDDDVDPADAELDKLPPLDIHLDEAKNIMVDLIQAVAKTKPGMSVSK